MGKPTADEVQILRYFEAEPLEKVRLLFKIISEKMRERTGGKQDGEAENSVRATGAAKKRRSESERDAGSAAPTTDGADA